MLSHVHATHTSRSHVDDAALCPGHLILKVDADLILHLSGWSKGHGGENGQDACFFPFLVTGRKTYADVVGVVLEQTEAVAMQEERVDQVLESAK